MNMPDEPVLVPTWPVAQAYAWTDWLNNDHRRVVPRNEDLASRQAVFAAANRIGPSGPVLAAVPRTGEKKRYDLMDRSNSGVFREFAVIDRNDRDAILAFARRYGLLGLEVQYQHVPRRGRHPRHVAHGESYFAWNLAICEMQEAIVRLEQPRDDASPDLLTLVNKHLTAVQWRMAQAPDRAYRISFTPNSLLGAMWLQLALAMVEVKRFERCKYKHCPKFIEISTSLTGRRTNSEFCSNACKTKDYRERIRLAVELWRDGRDLRSIAKETHTEPQTIKRWVTSKFRKHNLGGR